MIDTRYNTLVSTLLQTSYFLERKPLFQYHGSYDRILFIVVWLSESTNYDRTWPKVAFLASTFFTDFSKRKKKVRFLSTPHGSSEHWESELPLCFELWEVQKCHSEEVQNFLKCTLMEKYETYYVVKIYLKLCMLYCFRWSTE